MAKLWRAGNVNFLQKMNSFSLRFEELLEFMADWLGIEVELQGHKLTGKLIKSIAPKADAETLTGAVLWERYGEAINEGVDGSRIPYFPGSGRKTSKFIAALARYAMLRRMQPKPGQTYLNIAFAIANAQKKSRMPTPGSFAYTKTGKRTQAVEEMVKKRAPGILDKAELAALAYLEELLHEALEQLALAYQYITIKFS